MSFEQTLADGIKNAMLAKDQLRLEVLRAMKSALKYKFVEKNQQELTEEECLQVFQSMMKQRKDSFEQFTKAGRADLAEKEKKEIDVITEFLPQGLSETEVKQLIQSTIKSIGAASAQDMGKVMKELRAKVVGRADQKLVADWVREALASPNA